MAVKLKDIARVANVSEATVSLALNNSKLVKEETRNRIKNIARELGYSPNAMARGLARQKSGTIGLIVPDIESAYYGKLVRCIDQDVREAGYGLILAISNDKPEVEKKIISSFISQRVEGIIITPINKVNKDLSYMKQLEKHNIPFVFVTAHYPGVDAPCVMVDLEDGTYKLVKYLLSLGHRNITFLAGSQKVITTSYRVNGYKKAFKEEGLNVDETNFIKCDRLNYEEAREVTAELLREKKNIDAIITINDMMALGVINTLKEDNIWIPEDVSVAGYDNTIFSTISSVPITTVHQDIEKMSWNSVNMLVNILKEGNVKTKSILIKPELVIRESTGLKS